MKRVANPALVYLSKWPEKSDTGRTMRQALNRVAGVLEEGADAQSYAWQEMRYEDARSIAALLADEDLQPATINKLLSAVRGVLESAWRLGTMPDDVYRKIEIENVAGNAAVAGRALSREEMDAIHVELDKAVPRDAAVIAVLAGAGVRRVELVRLRGDDYTQVTGRLEVLGKRNKRRAIPIGDRWRPAIAHWKTTLSSASARMFDFGDRNPRRQVSYVVKKFCDERKLRPFTPHDLRRTFATHVEKVAGIAVAKKLLGHESIRTTALYVRVDEAREHAAVKDL